MAMLLGIDLGTSGCKAIVVDEAGRVLGSATAEYPISTPRPLWSEQDPEDWWQGVLSCLGQLANHEPDAVGLTGQMHGAVFLDRDGRMIRPAILWNDQRTVVECQEIDRVVGRDNVRRITCNPPLTGFQLPKILWLRNNEPEMYAAVAKVLLPKDYIRYKLTGEHLTEVSDASGTGIFDVPRRTWSAEMISALKLDANLFPESAESAEPTSRVAEGTSLKSGVQIVGGGGDQAAGAVGTGAVEPGVVSISLGTSGVVFTSIRSPEYDPTGSAHTFCHANGAWHAMGVMLSCGGALRWYRDTFGAGEDYGAIAESASSVAPGCDGMTFLPYLTGERTPHNDPFARASWGGATLSHTRAHFARSVFEGVTFGLLDGFRALEKLGAASDEIRVTGGGAKSRFWVQMIADVFGKPCVTLESDEGPAFGAAILAGVGIGIWPDVASACATTVRTKERTEPSGEDFSCAFQRYGDLYKCLRDWNLR